MKKFLPFVKLGRIWLMSCMLVFMSHLSLPQNQPLAYSKSLPLDSGPQNRQELGTFLKQLEISHHIHFVYQKGLLDGKILDATLMVADEDEAIEKILDKVLQPFHLQYKKLKGESAYAIVPIHTSKKSFYPPNAETSQSAEASAHSVNADSASSLSQFSVLSISGQVINNQQQGIPGVSVVLKGTTTGTATDADGRYALTVPDGNGTLVFSYIGYVTENVPVGSQSVINVTLLEDIASLQEVVVTALGIKKQVKALTYHVQEINGLEVNAIRDPNNFVNSLAGKVAGVTINSSSAGLGGSVRVVMRGAKSLIGNNNALYVVDGIPLPNLLSGQSGDAYDSGTGGDGIANINPDDIASMSVLTGPAAAALYGGSQAANGVVLITTKKGEGGKLRVSIGNSTSFLSPFVLPRFQNTYGSEGGSFSSWGAKLTTPSSYNPADFFQTGLNSINNLSLSTGSDRNQTYVSASSANGKGIIPNNTLARYTFSVRNTSTFLNDKLNLDLSLMYVNQTEQNMLAQGQYFNPLVPIYLFPRGDDIQKYQVFERYDVSRNFKTQFWPFGDLGFSAQNPYWITQRNLSVSQRDRYLLGTGLKYTFSDWLSLTGRVKLDNTTNGSETKRYASTYGLFASPTGYYGNSTAITKQWYADVLLTFSKSVRHFTYNANLGSSLLDTRYASTGYGGNLLSVPNLFSFTNVDLTSARAGQDGYHDQVQAVYGNGQISYKNLLFLDATARSDWPSALVNTTDKFIFYPTIGLSAIVSDMLKIAPNNLALSFLKVRGSYSEVGNSPPRFITIVTYPLTGGNPATSSYLPATGLKPERTKSYEAGFSLKFLKNTLSLDVTAYHSSTYNQLFNPGIAPSTGYSSLYVNAGQVDNKGIEAVLGYNANLGQLKWTANATFTLNRNKVVELLPKYTDPLTGTTVSQDRLNFGGTGSYLMIVEKGGSIGDIYVNTLQTDEQGYIQVNSETGTIAADPNRYIKAGSVNPRYSLGFNNSLSYKNITLSFLVDARIGGIGVSATQAILDQFGVSEASAQARDQGGVEINGYKVDAKSYYSVAAGGIAGIGSRYVYSLTNARLREASVSYHLPTHLFNNRIQGITLSVTGRNLFMFYNKAPFDPESTASTGTYYQGIDYFMQPSLRGLGFSIKAQL